MSKSLIKKYVFWPEINNAFHNKIDFGQTPTKEVIEQINITPHKTRLLENDIFRFYAYNEHFNNLRNKESGVIEYSNIKEFQEYQHFLNQFSQNIFSYIIYCCIGEAFHSKYLADIDLDSYKNYAYKYGISLLAEDKTSKYYKYYLKKYKSVDKFDRISYKSYLENKFYDYDDLPKFIKDIISFDSKDKFIDKLVAKINKSFPHIQEPEFDKFIAFLISYKIFKEQEHEKTNFKYSDEVLLRKSQYIEQSSISNISIEKTLFFISTFFKKGFISGYGGKAWANIAEHALFYTQGKINTEMFVDRALSLEHNGGNMFNKKYIFETSYNNFSFNYFLEDENAYEEKIYLHLKEILFNLQNSSSVNIFSLKESLNSIISLSYKEITPFIKEIIKHSSLSNEEFDIKNMIFYYKNYATQFYNFLTIMEKNNLSFIKSINKNHNSSNFNITNFFISLSKTHQDGKKVTKFITNYSQELEIFNKLISYINLKDTHKNISNNTKNHFSFYELDKIKKVLPASLIGGKAKGIYEISQLGLNTPQAMVFDTSTCLSYLSNKKYFQEQFKLNISTFISYLKDKDGNPDLVSVRSGAPISMPGMMDTILNVGIDDSTYPHLIEKYGQKMIDECALSFMHQFCSSKLNINISLGTTLEKAVDTFTNLLIKNNIPCNRRAFFPLTSLEQLQYCVETVFDSWNSPRSVSWRQEKNISYNIGTSATIQKMVFGNLNKNSMTCVLFSRNCINGENKLIGEYLIGSQGDDLVSGKKTPLNIDNLKKDNPSLYKEFFNISKKLENYHKAIQDIEITVENGKVYVLQKRNAVISEMAKIKLIDEFKLSTTETFDINNILGQPTVKTDKTPEYTGLSANPGVIRGIVVKNEKDIAKYSSTNTSLIFLADQALPEHAPIMIKTNAFITQSGGATSHAAIIARSMNKPCIVGLGKVNIKSGDIITIDSINGYVWKDSLPIVNNKKTSNNITLKILDENNVKDKHHNFVDFSISSWNSSFTNSKIVEKKKYDSFLSLAQKSVITLLLNNKHNNTIKT